MANIAFIFPGQGSQTVGMAKEIYDSFPEAKEIIDQANDILGFDLKKLMFEGSKEELQKTENAQPALLCSSIALLTLLEKNGIKANVCAGHSLGEFSAYVAAKALSFKDGLLTVRKRGELMANSDPEKKGTMAAIIGLDDSVVEDICKQASSEGVVIPANYNSPGQLVISGERKGVERAIELAKEQKAKMAIPLDVSGAFHSPLIEQASQEFGDFLKGISFIETQIPVISNTKADVVEFSGIKSSLVQQMISSVLWKKSVAKMIDMGADTFVEVGVGKVLQGLVKKIDRKIQTIGIDTPDSFHKAVEQLR